MQDSTPRSIDVKLYRVYDDAAKPRQKMYMKTAAAGLLRYHHSGGVLRKRITRTRASGADSVG